MKVHFLRDLVRDGHVKLVRCVGTQNVSDTLTKSLPRPAFEKHREFMVETGVPFTAFHASETNAVEHEPLAAYVVKLPTPMYSKKRPLLPSPYMPKACKKERKRKGYKNPVHYIL